MLSSLAKVMNTALALDPESGTRISKLHGKVITIELLPFHYQFQCHFDDHEIQLKKEETDFADTLLRGTPLQMMGVMMTKENRHQFFAEDLVIEGDAETGQLLIEIFDHLQIDWEEQLSKITGDVPAHHAANLVRKFKNFLRHAEKSISENIDEYMHEEKKWLPSREALSDFFCDIDELRMDVDRMEARINLIRDESIT